MKRTRREQSLERGQQPQHQRRGSEANRRRHRLYAWGPEHSRLTGDPQQALIANLAEMILEIDDVEEESHDAAELKVVSLFDRTLQAEVSYHDHYQSCQIDQWGKRFGRFIHSAKDSPKKHQTRADRI